jgi:hypothetical protein
MLFFASIREQLTKKDKLTFGEAGKAAGERWHALSEQGPHTADTRTQLTH